jgi:hypothetical protein
MSSAEPTKPKQLDGEPRWPPPPRQPATSPANQGKGCFIAPTKGLKKLAQDFNPGNHLIERFALKKGREISIFLTCVINAFDLDLFFSLGRYDSQGLNSWA